MTSRAREFVQSFGPAWIVMTADVDAPSIFTAATAGALYGYGLAWFFLVLILPLFVVQEASGGLGLRLGRVWGKSPAPPIPEGSPIGSAWRLS